MPWTVCHVLCSDFTIQSSRRSREVSPFYRWGNWGPERASHLSRAGRFWARAAWLHGADTWVLVKATQFLLDWKAWAHQYPVGSHAQVTDHARPSPHTRKIIPPSTHTLGATAPRSAGTVSLWDIGELNFNQKKNTYGGLVYARHRQIQGQFLTLFPPFFSQIREEGQFTTRNWDGEGREGESGQTRGHQ